MFIINTTSKTGKIPMQTPAQPTTRVLAVEIKMARV